MKQLKKTVSLFVTLVLAWSLVPMPAWAQIADEWEVAMQDDAADSSAAGAETAPTSDAEQEDFAAGSQEALPEDEAPPLDDGQTDALANPNQQQLEIMGSEDPTANGAAAQTDASASTPAEQEPAAEDEWEADGELSTQGVEDDPVWFEDAQTGTRVTTLHTTGTYVVRAADGSVPQELSALTFELMDSSSRSPMSPFTLDLKVDHQFDAGEPTTFVVLEGFKELTYAPRNEWEIPSGYYRIYPGYPASTDALSQRYHVVNDGLFQPFFDFMSEYSQGYDPTNYHEFSVKAYDANKTDKDYDAWVYDDQTYTNAERTPELEPLDLDADLRLRLEMDFAEPINNQPEPQLLSIGLWKSEDTIEELEGTYDDQSGRYDGKYTGYADWYISRVAAVRESIEDGPVFADLPTFPHYLNFSDAGKVTNLWERGESDLGERFVPSDGTGSTAQDSYTAQFIVDRANFSGAAVEGGLYYPIVKVLFQGETYTYAYYPIEVTAGDVSARRDPRITTSALRGALAGDAYSLTLGAQSGALHPGTFGWDVVAGELPAGLALDHSSGTISGTPSAAGEAFFRVRLTESADGVERSCARDFTLRVSPAPDPESAVDQLSLGTISYTPGPVWLQNRYGRKTYTTLSIPISLDVRDPRYDLGKTELWYMLGLTDGRHEDPTYYVWHEPAADLMSDDGATLQVSAILENWSIGLYDTTSITSIRAWLIPYNNDGTFAVDPGKLLNPGTSSDGTPYPIYPIGHTLAFRHGALGTNNNGDGISYTFVQEDGSTQGDWLGDYSSYGNFPEVPHTIADNPNITIGSWIRFPSIDFGGDRSEWPTDEGRIRLWEYDGTTAPTKQVTKGIAVNYNSPGDWHYEEGAGTATFKLAPGTYAFVVEGSVDVRDEYGEPTGEKTWVDIGGSVAGARALPNTYPQQYVMTVGPGEGTSDEPRAVSLSFTSTNYDFYRVSPTFEQADGTFAQEYVSYEASWYRRIDGRDVLVATGELVSLEASDAPLFVEVVPKGADASFWKRTGKVAVAGTSHTAEVQVPRKALFPGTFHLSCASGESMPEGEPWGIIEVRTPLEEGGYASSNLWPRSSAVEIPNLTSGSIVTFTPRSELLADAVGFTVPEDADAAFDQDLLAPMSEGLIGFGRLAFTDVEGNTRTFALNDGYTDVSVHRLVTSDDSTFEVAVPFRITDDSHLALMPELGLRDHQFNLAHDEVTYRIRVSHRDRGAPDSMADDLVDYAASHAYDVTLSPQNASAIVGEATLVSRGYALVSLANPQARACTLMLYKADEGLGGSLVDYGEAGATAQQELRTPFLDAGHYMLYAVDQTMLTSFGTPQYASLTELNQHMAQHQGYVSHVEFDVSDGRVTTVESGLNMPTGGAAGIVNRAASSVFAQPSYSDYLTITMHVELSAGAVPGSDPYIQLQTNQPSGIEGAGYVAPASLSINGKPVTINRWGDNTQNVFRGTQNMDKGDLQISLSQVADSVGGTFPLDVTVVVPRTDSTSTSVKAWLVCDSATSVIGSFDEQLKEASITVPPRVAWQTFGVYGSTGAWAEVIIFLNGMRAATTHADAYGFYSAQLTLPEGVREGEEFTVSANCQWKVGDGATLTATTDAQSTVYTNVRPAVERVTLCYQPQPNSLYSSMTVYDKGLFPGKYLTYYRAENENTNPDGDDGEHAKFFWVIEFANAQRAQNVHVSVPLSTSDIEMETTSNIRQAEAWIDDAQLLSASTPLGTTANNAWGGTTKSMAGDLVRATLVNGTGFVCRPTYLPYPPQNIDVSFEDGTNAFGTLGVFKLSAPLTHEQSELLTPARVSAFLEQARQGTYVFETSDDDATLAASIANRQRSGTGTVEETLLLGSGPSTGRPAEWENLWLPITLRSTRVAMDANDIRAEVDGLANGAKDTLEAAANVEYVSQWSDEFDYSKRLAELSYKGNAVVNAYGAEAGNPSDLYYIETVDAGGNAQVESLHAYQIGDSPQNLYHYLRLTKGQFTRINWNEQEGTREEVTYTVDVAGLDREKMDFVDLMYEWNTILNTLVAGHGEAEDELIAAEQALGTQSADQGEDVTLLVQRVPTGGEIVDGVVGGANTVGKWFVNQFLIGDSRRMGPGESMQLAKAVRDNPEIAAHAAAEGGSIKDSLVGQIGGSILKNNAKVVGEKGVDAASSAVPLPADWVTTTGFSVLQTWVGNAGMVDNVFMGKPDYYSDEYDDLSYKWYCMMRKHGATKKQCKEAFPPDLLMRHRMRWRIEHRRVPQSKGVADPSGIVYEAVLSNPVQDAQVELYTYGEAGKNAVFVDSEMFNIEPNPQKTDADGRYQWFVPSGYWQIRVSKPGYESVSTGDSADYGIGATKTLSFTREDGSSYVVQEDSYWMPVLPEQLDVNIGLVSTATPKVASVEATEDEVRVTFSQYVKADLAREGAAWKDLFAIQTDGDGALAPSAAEPVDAEIAGNGSGELLARTFVLSYPEGAGFAESGSHLVNVSFDDKDGIVRNYAGRAMASYDRSTTQQSFVYVEPVYLTSIDGARDATYTGSAIRQASLVVKAGDVEVAEENYTLSYSNNTNAGRAKVTATGTGRYAGTVSTTFAIQPMSIAATSIASIATQTYTGSSIRPAPKVTMGGKALAAGTDYTVSYKNNVNVGTATVTVTGKGNYQGTKSATFKIGVKKVTPAVTLSKSTFTYNGKVQKPSVTVTADGKRLDASSYTVTWPKGMRDVGTYRVSVALKGNYAGSASSTFRITAKKVTPAVTLSKSTFTYNGKAQKPTLTVKVGGTKLPASSYAITWPKGMKAAGTYAVKVALKGNYSGTKSVSYKISKAANTMKASAKAASAAAKTLKSKAVVLSPITVKSAIGKVTYKKASGAASLSVNAKTGKVTVKKGTKKGTYTIKVKVTAAGDANRKALSKVVAVKVTVK